jgi:predicted nucleic acid-binding OB-fold protein
MDTLRTQRVRKFTDFYNKLKTVTGKIERLDLLGEISETLTHENNPAIEEVWHVNNQEQTSLSNIFFVD